MDELEEKELLEELDKATARISTILVTGYPELNKWGRAKAQIVKIIVEHFKQPKLKKQIIEFLRVELYKTDAIPGGLWHPLIDGIEQIFDQFKEKQKNAD